MRAHTTRTPTTTASRRSSCSRSRRPAGGRARRGGRRRRRSGAGRTARRTARRSRRPRDELERRGVGVVAVVGVEPDARAAHRITGRVEVRWIPVSCGRPSPANSYSVAPPSVAVVASKSEVNVRAQGSPGGERRGGDALAAVVEGDHPVGDGDAQPDRVAVRGAGGRRGQHGRAAGDRSSRLRIASQPIVAVRLSGRYATSGAFSGAVPVVAFGQVTVAVFCTTGRNGIASASTADSRPSAAARRRSVGRDRRSVEPIPGGDRPPLRRSAPGRG